MNFLIKKGANDFDEGVYASCNGGHLNIADLMINKGATYCHDCIEPIYKQHNKKFNRKRKKTCLRHYELKYNTTSWNNYEFKIDRKSNLRKSI